MFEVGRGDFQAGRGCGGLEKVFEINRNFRNEGADSSHSPEFAMIETYEAYGDWNTMAELTRSLVQDAAKAVFGSHKVKHHDGKEIDLGGKWKELSLFEVISESVGEKVNGQTSKVDLTKIAAKNGIKIDPKWVTGKIAEEIFEHVAKDKLIEPTFVKGFPIDTSPLVRAHRDTAGIVEKWDLYIQGFELATGYSELIDPVIQRERLTEQVKLGASGDLEAMGLDEDFLKAMEYAMPPMGGDWVLDGIKGWMSLRHWIRSRYFFKRTRRCRGIITTMWFGMWLAENTVKMDLVWRMKSFLRGLLSPMISR